MLRGPEDEDRDEVMTEASEDSNANSTDERKSRRKSPATPVRPVRDSGAPVTRRTMVRSSSC
jgi:hypothetical protein